MKITFNVEIENTNTPEQCGCRNQYDIDHLAESSKWELDNSVIVLLKAGVDINGKRVNTYIPYVAVTLDGETEPCSVINETEGENGTDY